MLGPEDLDNFVFDEEFFNRLDQGQDALVINLRQFVIMCSEQIVKFTSWLAEVDALTDSRLVLFTNRFVSLTLSGILGHIFSVFADRNELEIAVRQEVVLKEKEMLWS